MNKKWDEIKERLSKLSLPQENIEPLTFLPPAEWHVERCKKREVLVVAETMPQHENSICLVVDLRGRVYRANLPAYEIYQYCANSFPWFEKAFSGGMILAGRNYCHYYEHGRGDLIPPEPEKEVPIMRRGAELGYPEWMYAYAHYLHYTEEKDKEALSWALKAAEAGHLWSWHIVGDLYWDGKDVEHDQSYSIECYEKTAGYGNDSYACRQLGRMYFNGWGTAVDYARAVQWLERDKEPDGESPGDESSLPAAGGAGGLLHLLAAGEHRLGLSGLCHL